MHPDERANNKKTHTHIHTQTYGDDATIEIRMWTKMYASIIIFASNFLGICSSQEFVTYIIAVFR